MTSPSLATQTDGHPVRLYVVTATLNGLEHTKALEAALRAATLPLRLVVIDNGSLDGTREWLSELCREDQICVVNERNLGVAGSWNLGIRIAVANRAQAILICGNDTVPMPGTVERLLELIRLNLPFVTGTACDYATAVAPVPDVRPDDVLLTAPDFSFFMMSADVLSLLEAHERTFGLHTFPGEAGLFDSRVYPAYFEDNDFAVRLDVANIPAFRDSLALFRHDTSFTVRTSTGVRRDVQDRFECNRRLFLQKWPAEEHRLRAQVAPPLNEDAVDAGRGREPVRATVSEAIEIARSGLARRFERRGPNSPLISMPARSAPEPPRLAPPKQAKERCSASALPETSHQTVSRFRIMVASNAPWVPTGYGNQTKLLVPRLVASGYEVAIHCLFGLEGGVIRWDGIQCFPRGQHPLGQDIMGAHAECFEADLVISLMDVWGMDPSLHGPDVRWMPWFPIDHEPIPPAVRRRVAQSWRGIAMSRFGVEQCRQAGLEVEYAPHGVDTNVFRPGNRDDARRRLGLPASAFVVGMVAANKDYPSRKAFPQCLEAFAEFRRVHRDAVLYLHTPRAGTAPRGGTDLGRLVEHLGITDAVVFTDAYALVVGCNDAFMVDLYSAFDVLLNPSFGEGFGIPILEAQACGCPVIVGDWTSMSELCFAGWKIPKSEALPWWTPLASYQFVPRAGAIVDALDLAFNEDGGEGLAATARAGAARYDVDQVVREHWVPILERARSVVRGSAGAG